jgi:hypothetical protein
MKKIIFIISFSLFVMTGCDDFLNEQPVQSLSAETFWKTPEDAAVGIAALYDGLQKVLSNNYFDWGEGRSDNFTAGGTGQFQVDIALGNLSATMDAARWDDLYRTISIANFAIKYLPRITELDARNRDHYLAQAHAMRALCYFYAVRVWGDVPVVTEPYEDLALDPRKARTNATEVLNNVIMADIDKAYELVDKTVVTPVWNINVGAILALKTDVHMWMHEYQKALDASQLLITLNRYKLETGTAGWKKVFTDPNATKEAIWSLYWNYLEEGNGNGIGGRTGNGSNTSAFELDVYVEQAFEASATTKKDIRRSQTYDTLKVGVNIDKIWKYFTANNGVILYEATGQCNAKVPLYRYADIVLLRAEAFNKLDNPTEAVKALNEIRTRAGLPTVLETDFADETALEMAILKERQLEFIAEGRRWFDLVRTGHAIEVMDPILKARQAARGLAQTGFGGEDRIVFPIHRDIINANKLIEQNDAYK